MTTIEERPRDLPAVDSLSSHQRRGVDCVFCGTSLRPGFLRDLGEQYREVYGHRVRWFPRSCLPCLTRPRGTR